MNSEELHEALSGLTTAVTRISYGGTPGPSGFEALCMAIQGENVPGKGGTLCESLDNIAMAINKHADAMDRIADVLERVIPKAGLGS